jgi:hypothetical protein
MPKRPSKPVGKAPPAGEKIASRAKESAGKIKEDRIASTGLTSRVRGHIAARGKRAQARRDQRS